MASNGLVSNFSQYAAARTVSMLLNLFGIEENLSMARGIGSLLWKVDRRHRKRAVENLRASFPEKSEEEINYIAKRSIQHFVELVMDVFFTTREIQLETWHKHVRLKNLEEPIRMLLRERGAIMLTGHYGNWEVLGYTLATLGFETYSIARPIDNPFVDSWLLGVREKKGQIILSKRGVTTTAQEVLENRKVLGVIADQNAGERGMFVPFFGRLASTYKTIGLLAMQYDLPVIIGYARRMNNRFEFEVGVKDIIYPEDWKNLPKDLPLVPSPPRGAMKPQDELYYISARYTKALEDIVRDDPTQYLWIHRRWKSRPKWEKADGDARS
jgi:KDO2-lipid IV(A) lauroyltransferase